MTCAGSRKGGCSFRKCKCRRRPCLSVCICISMLDGRKGRRKRSLPVSFICLEETEFNEETKLSPVENVQRGKEEERRRGGGKQIRNRRRVYSKTVRLVRIHAAICVADDLTEPMNRVPTKFFSVRGGALSRDAINSPTINSPVSLLRERGK